eukprot:s2801_g13.t1
MLYVDGSCEDSGKASTALAGWCVVSANLGKPVGAGLLPSPLQTSNRSEVWALTMAIQWLIDFHCDGHIHTDSQYAADGFWFLVKSYAVPSDWQDRDLWDALLQRIQIQAGVLQVIKVRAHLSLTGSTTAQSSYDTYWNAVADTGAKTARLSCCPVELANVRKKLLSINQWQIFWTRRSQEFLLELALHHVQFQSTSDAGQVVQWDPEDELVCILSDAAPNPRDWQDTFPIHLSAAIANCPALMTFGFDISLAFCRWLLQLDLQAENVKRITFVEFFYGFSFGGGI